MISSLKPQEEIHETFAEMQTTLQRKTQENQVPEILGMKQEGGQEMFSCVCTIPSKTEPDDVRQLSFILAYIHSVSHSCGLSWPLLKGSFIPIAESVRIFSQKFLWVYE